MRVARIVFGLAALVAGGVGLKLGVDGSLGAMVWAVGLSGAFLLVAFLDQIERFRLGPGGVEATTRALERIQVQMDDLQQLAAAIAHAILTTAEGSGRIGGIADELKAGMTDGLLNALERIRLPEQLKRDIFADVNRYVVHDYGSHILGGAMIPTDRHPQLQSDWRALRERALGSTATPDEIQSFLQAYGLLTAERQDLLDDYRHFLKHSAHRRPSVWANRHSWNRL